MKSKRLKDLMREADILWSQVVHKKNRGMCEMTGHYGNQGNDPHHAFLRRHTATRWDLSNGVLLSRGMHEWAHKNQKLFRIWFKCQIGNKAYDRLEKKSRETFQPTIANMEAIIKELEKHV